MFLNFSMHYCFNQSFFSILVYIMTLSFYSFLHRSIFSTVLIFVFIIHILRFILFNHSLCSCSLHFCQFNIIFLKCCWTTWFSWLLSFTVSSRIVLSRDLSVNLFCIKFVITKFVMTVLVSLHVQFTFTLSVPYVILPSISIFIAVF